MPLGPPPAPPAGAPAPPLARNPRSGHFQRQANALRARPRGPPPPHPPPSPPGGGGGEAGGFINKAAKLRFTVCCKRKDSQTGTHRGGRGGIFSWGGADCTRGGGRRRRHRPRQLARLPLLLNGAAVAGGACCRQGGEPLSGRAAGSGRRRRAPAEEGSAQAGEEGVDEGRQEAVCSSWKGGGAGAGQRPSNAAPAATTQPAMASRPHKL